MSSCTEQTVADNLGAGTAASLREADVMTVVTATPDKKWRTIKVLAGDDENHKRLVNYWIGQLSPSAAMSGLRLGKEKNECLSAADRLARVEAHSFASQLRDHHALVLAAERLQVPFTFWVSRGGPGSCEGRATRVSGFKGSPAGSHHTGHVSLQSPFFQRAGAHRRPSARWSSAACGAWSFLVGLRSPPLALFPLPCERPAPPQGSADHRKVLGRRPGGRR